jgi:hypothetical protein
MLKIKSILYIVVSYVLRISIFDRFIVFYVKRRIKVLSTGIGSNIGVAILDIDRFRDEIEAMLRVKKWSLINFSIGIQDKINALHAYSLENINRGKNQEFLRNKRNKKRVNYLRRILPKIIEQTQITCFLSCGMYYARNIDWEIACEEIGIPFLCLHREGVGVDANLRKKNMAPLVCNYRKFYGSKLLVGNNAFKDILVSNNYIDSEKISVVGVPRADLFVNYEKKPKKNKGKIVLFSFPHTALLTAMAKKEKKKFFCEKKKMGFYDLFYDVHTMLSLFAIENPDIDVIIKPKWYSGDWKVHIDKSIDAALNIKGKNSRIPNLRVIDDISAKKLIIDSSLVIAFNSSVILESVIAKIPVVIPSYLEASSKHSDSVAWISYLDRLNFAKSSSELKNYLNNYQDVRIIEVGTTNEMIAEAFGYGDGKNTERLYSQIKHYH